MAIALKFEITPFEKRRIFPFRGKQFGSSQCTWQFVQTARYALLYVVKQAHIPMPYAPSVPAASPQWLNAKEPLSGGSTFTASG